tara:strand:+ start:121 stop:1878 length:1758 start_codon:yes stop_codon:yes gene_type:complete
MTQTETERRRIINIIKSIYSHISNKRKKQLCIIFIIIFIAGGTEILSIASLLPLLTVFSDFNKIYNLPIISSMITSFGLNERIEILLFITLIFSLAVSLASTLRIFTFFISSRIAAYIGSEISFKVYRQILFQPYEVHLNRNTSEVISNITMGTQHSVTVLNTLLRLSYSSVVFIFVILGLFLYDFWLAIGLLTFFIGIYYLIALNNKKRLIKKSNKLYESDKKIIQLIQEGISSIRDLIIDNSHHYYLNSFKSADKSKRSIEAEMDFMSRYPYDVIECIALVSIASLGLAFSIFSYKESSVLALLGTLALALQKLLRALQGGYQSWTFIQGRVTALQKILDFLDLPIEPIYFNNTINSNFDLKQSIKLKGISFAYKDSSKNIISNFNININKGEMVGIVGRSGAGKSTMMDIIIGLLKPSKGSVLIDGIDINKDINITKKTKWFNSISHVPQNIYIPDSNFLESIAFGIPPDQIDFERVKESASKAKISEFIESKPAGYFTNVGERGSRLSGGQKQRIGIARALYKKAELLFFDEATSALDSHTESCIMSSIAKLKSQLTIIIITHRINTLKDCDRIINLDLLD